MHDNDLISRDDAIALIEGFQRELCPVGMYGRHAVYGTDREKFDNWQFIVDELEKVPGVDAAPIRHGEWIKETDRENRWHCSVCGVVVGIVAEYAPYCYKCGAKMDGGDE